MPNFDSNQVSLEELLREKIEKYRAITSGVKNDSVRSYFQSVTEHLENMHSLADNPTELLNQYMLELVTSELIYGNLTWMSDSLTEDDLDYFQVLINKADFYQNTLPLYVDNASYQKAIADWVVGLNSRIGMDRLLEEILPYLRLSLQKKREEYERLKEQEEEEKLEQEEEEEKKKKENDKYWEEVNRRKKEQEKAEKEKAEEEKKRKEKLYNAGVPTVEEWGILKNQLFQNLSSHDEDLEEIHSKEHPSFSDEFERMIKSIGELKEALSDTVQSNSRIGEFSLLNRARKNAKAYIEKKRVELAARVGGKFSSNREQMRYDLASKYLEDINQTLENQRVKNASLIVQKCEELAKLKKECAEGSLNRKQFEAYAAPLSNSLRMICEGKTILKPDQTKDLICQALAFSMVQKTKEGASFYLKEDSYEKLMEIIKGTQYFKHISQNQDILNDPSLFATIWIKDENKYLEPVVAELKYTLLIQKLNLTTITPEVLELKQPVLTKK